jgi:LDH2 family malate/lactate/ureidoglycolate dehydrogenase
MKVSRNELTACLKKAFEGLGFSVGDYEDAAAMVVWSQMHGFNGLQQLQQALPFLSNCPCLHAQLISDTDQQALLDGQQSSVLLCGSQTVRLACAIARQHGSGHVRLDNCHNRKFIIQRLVSAAQLGTALIAYWVDGSTGVKVMIEPYAKQPEYQEHQEHQEYSVADITANQSLFIFAGSDLASLEQQFLSQFNLGAQFRRFSTEAMRDSYQFRLEQGIEIDEQFWSELDNLVARVLVESTDSSRAGAGD